MPGYGITISGFYPALREAPEADFHGSTSFRSCVSVSDSLKLKIGRLLHEIHDF